MNEIADNDAIVRGLTAGPLMTNYYVLGCPKTKSAAIVDAGWAADEIVAMATEAGLTIDAIWQTHAHIDHVAALGEAKELTGAPIWLHRADEPLYVSAPQQGQFFGYQIDPLPAVDRWFDDGDEIRIGELTGEVMFLPGHSPGSVGFWFEELGLFFGGDVLFAGSIGRVDLPGSDPKAMKRSLQRLVDELPDDAQVLCGHGPTTTIGMEKRRNPFLLQDW